MPAQAGSQAGCVFSKQFVLPDPHDAPCGFAQGGVYQTVARLVTLDFFNPELGVVFWSGPVLPASVPEAAVHKQCDLVIPKHKIRLSKHGLSPPPTGNPQEAEKDDQREFRPLVSVGADARHHF